MALPVPTKSLLRTSPDTAMLFAPFGCSHPPSPVPPFLLTQNLSPKDIAGSDIMKFRKQLLILLYPNNQHSLVLCLPFLSHTQINEQLP